MNLEKQVKFDLDKVVNNIAPKEVFNENSVNTDRNRIKGYKDFL